MFKRILASMLLFTLVATVAPSIDQASASGTTYYVKVNSGSLNMRNKPATSGKIVAKLPKNQLVTVSSQSKGWAKVSTKGKTGYVSSKYIAPKTTKKTSAPKPVTKTADYKAKAISVAKSNLGVKYKWGGNTTSGFDCSGLVTYSFDKAGVKLPRTASEMYSKAGTKVTSFQPGDLLFYATSGGKKVTHVAIYIGNGQMIHSATSKGVSIVSINNSYWKPKFIGAKRI
ncbi:C40 family peptidase [Mesobacillus selenatarsenatis]|uniref:NLP/P60 family protein n=1 Tax=Mesobacillus selenatarsenatis (strain DSM 18680 / JCM 14380 / FERM P-15431 / SF-1) TaxID=1321606 RepID=A0A0A8XDG6_MESS1|nr:C40 family peptidase [Mesobacillus selenatarsenatis]GAM16211.1 NLP/P60 family protein [Mesobacillus selenatarsenatis SF-1]